MRNNSKKGQAIVVSNLHKSYKNLKVLRGINFSVKKGSIMALLGPNGAGKTTTIRILSTLLNPDRGTATIDHVDVFKNPDGVKAKIGLTGQFAAVDEYLTGRENLEMIGELYHLDKKITKNRTAELLKHFDLVEASTRPVKTYSGGMRRRLDLAMSLIASPPIIFLDEPTTGLDPRSRLTMWEIIKNLVAKGTTILLTTQDMDEADHLADQIIVIDKGQVIAEGSASDLKRKVGADRLEITISKKSNFNNAINLIKNNNLKSDLKTRTLSIATKGGVRTLKEMLGVLEKGNIEVENISLHRPTLDDVFLTLTGHTATKDEKINKSK